MCRAIVEGGRRCDGSHLTPKYRVANLSEVKSKAARLYKDGTIDANPFAKVSSIAEAQKFASKYKSCPEHNPLRVELSEADLAARKQQRVEASERARRDAETRLAARRDMDGLTQPLSAKRADLSRSSTPAMQQLVADRAVDPSAPEHVRFALSKGVSPQALAVNPTARLTAATESHHPKTLNVLAMDEVDAVREQVARNPATPRSVLAYLANDANASIANRAGDRLRVADILKLY